MPKFELEKVGFINPDDNTENVVFSTILEGSEGATRSFVEDSAEGYVTEDNQMIEDDIIYEFTALGKKTDNTDQAQLYSWANAPDKVTISGFAYDKALIIENAYLRQRAKGTDRLTWMVGAKKAGDVGYDSNGKLDTETMMSQNLLNMYYWQEGSTADLAAGWNKTGGSTVWDDVNNEQDFSTTGVTEVFMRRDIPFPFEKEVTFFITVDAVTVTTGVTISIQAIDEDGAVIGSATSEAVSATGTASVTKTLPAGTINVRIRVGVGQDDSISWSDPGLNLGTSTTYISQ